MLHITNGDCVVDGFRAGSIPGTYLPWRDVLHDGAVPRTSSLAALSDIRARVVADLSVESYDAIRSSFAERDRTLADFRRHDETVLWFEHDLYDQLQLIQILDWFSQQDLTGVRLTLIQIGEHPEVPSFHGLGELNGQQLQRLLPSRVPVTQRQLAIGRDAWEAFRAPEPMRLLDVARRVEPEMPFLAAAVQRFLEEYPSLQTGLSRTERQLLAAGAAGARHRREFYERSQSFEFCPWGDLSVYMRLDRLATGPSPALDRVGADEFSVNDTGRRLLTGEDDWLRSQQSTDLWLGGVHLTSPNGWRWSEDERTLKRAH
jgi:hypothetical protein